MKKTLYTLIAILWLTTGASAALPTLLSVGCGGLSIVSGTVFSVQGLEYFRLWWKRQQIEVIIFELRLVR